MSSSAKRAFFSVPESLLTAGETFEARTTHAHAAIYTERLNLQASATSPDHGAVHGTGRLGEDRAMMCGRESHGATAKESRGRLSRGIPLIPLNPGESRLAIKWWLARLAGSPAPSHSHARTCSGHPRVFQGPAGLAEGDARNESGHDGGVVRAGETEGLMDARIPGTSPGKPGHDVGKSTRAGRAMRKHRAGAWEFLEWDVASQNPTYPT